MKIKKLAKSLAAILLGATVGLSAFAFVGCKDDEEKKDTPIGGEDNNGGDVNGGENNGSENNDPPIVIDDPANATITVSVDKSEITAGTNTSVQASATIENFSDKTVVWSVSGAGANYVDINSSTGVLSLKSGLYPGAEVQVTLTATCTSSSQIKASTIVTIKPQVVVGEVKDLTTEMFTALGDPAITVTGEVTDIVDDLTATNNDQSRIYDFKVMMSDGAWYGEWNEKNSTSKTIDNYRRSENTVTGSSTHTFNQVYINKNNEVAQKAVTDYNSIAAIWENQHMWNHLSQLGTDIENQWKYDETNKVYVYQFDNTSVADLYLRTYLAYSLTPMLDNGDTLESIFLTVEDGKITKMEATTALNYYGAQEEGSSEGATSLAYTTLVANFSDVGTTKVPDPTPYEEDPDNDVLKEALANMGDAKNYTFRAVEETISAPDYDEGDYTEYSVSTYKTSASNNTSATGTEGVVGRVTSDAILLAKTGKYTASLDDKLYWTNYSGYKQVSEGYYDFFEYSANAGALVGTRQYKGNLFDMMPKFDFSAYIFKRTDDARVTINGQIRYCPTFVLSETAITRDIAMEVSAHSYASDAAAAPYASLIIQINPDTKSIYSIEFPYSLVSGTYLGSVRTTFSNIGTTTLPEDTFDGYVARVVPSDWSQLNVKYYHPDHTTASPYGDIDAGTLLTNIFGADASKMPSPDVFYKAFADTLAGPFFDWDTEDNTATGGDVKYHDWMSINVQVDEADENGKITQEQHDAIIAVLTEELAKIGFTKSIADCGTTYYGTNYTVYTNGSIMIKVENMRTRFFYIDFLPTAIWWHYDHDLDTAPNA